MTKKNIVIGKITAAHGIKGCVKIMSFAQNPQDIFNYQPIYDSKKERFFKFKQIGNFKGKNDDIFVVQIDGVADRNQAELLRGTELFIDYDHLPEASEDEFYYVDLIGLEAMNEEGEKFGKIANVGDFGAGSVMEIELKNKELQMLPFNDQTVAEVNIKKGYIKIIMPDIFEVK